MIPPAQSKMIAVTDIALNSVYRLPGRDVTLTDLILNGADAPAVVKYDLFPGGGEAMPCSMPLQDFLRAAELKDSPKAVVNGKTYSVPYVTYVAMRDGVAVSKPNSLPRKVWDLNYAGKDARYVIVSEFYLEEELF